MTDTPTFHLQLTVQSFVPVMLRQRQALILVIDEQDRFVLGSKKAYPEGIVRLVGGGIDPDETPYQGAHRELNEELGVDATDHQLQPLATIIADITREQEQRQAQFSQYLYWAPVKSADITANDDLDELVYYTEAEYRALLERFQELPKPNDPQFEFSWYDYGQLFYRTHQIALDEYLKLLGPSYS